MHVPRGIRQPEGPSTARVYVTKDVNAGSPCCWLRDQRSMVDQPFVTPRNVAWPHHTMCISSAASAAYHEQLTHVEQNRATTRSSVHMHAWLSLTAGCLASWGGKQLDIVIRLSKLLSFTGCSVHMHPQPAQQSRSRHHATACASSKLNHAVYSCLNRSMVLCKLAHAQPTSQLWCGPDRHQLKRFPGTFKIHPHAVH